MQNQVDAIHETVNFCSVFFSLTLLGKWSLREGLLKRNLSTYFKFSSFSNVNNSFIITTIIKEVLKLKSAVNT